jgi:hypothetical protein
MNAVFSNTNVPQIVSIESEKSYTQDLLTISFLVKARINRNTIQSLTIEYKPRTSQGALIDPIFQAPCTKIEGVAVTSINNEGNSTALQKREPSGDWFLEEYVIQSKTKLSKNIGPCPGSYLITGISLVDSAKKTLDLDVNLASTVAFVPTAPGSRQPATPARVVYTDTAIMQSNIWNSRPDLAPCTAGTNLAPVLTNVVVQGRTTQTFVAPTISNTNRVACSPIISFNLTNPLFSVAEGEYVSGKLSDDALKIFDYATEINKVSAELSKVSSELAALAAQNALLMAENARLKLPSSVSSTPKPKVTATPKPKVTATPKPKVTATKKPKATTPPKNPWSNRSPGGNSTWKPGSNSSQGNNSSQRNNS